jgi:hypothetical protein
VVEVAHLPWIERHLLTAVHIERHSTILIEALQGAKVPVGDLEVTVRGRELYPISDAKLVFYFTVCRYATQSSGIVGDEFAIRLPNRGSGASFSSLMTI